MKVSRMVAIGLSVVALALVVALLADPSSLYKRTFSMMFELDTLRSFDISLEGGVWKWEIKATTKLPTGVLTATASGDNVDMCHDRATAFRGAQAAGIMSAVFALPSIVAAAVGSPKLAGGLNVVTAVLTFVLFCMMVAAYATDYGFCDLELSNVELKHGGESLKLPTQTMDLPQLADGSDVHFAIPVALIACVLNIVGAVLCCCTSPDEQPSFGQQATGPDAEMPPKGPLPQYPAQYPAMQPTMQPVQYHVQQQPQYPVQQAQYPVQYHVQYPVAPQP